MRAIFICGNCGATCAADAEPSNEAKLALAARLEEKLTKGYDIPVAIASNITKDFLDLLAKLEV